MTEANDYHPVVGRIIALLTEASCSFKTFEHEEVRTSEEAAAVRPDYILKQGAKALIVRARLRGVPKEAEKQFVQVVVPGDAKFDTAKLRSTLNAKDIRFATEEEVEKITGGVKPGGVPPFGNLFGIAVYVDDSLLVHKEIIFNAGDRRFSVALDTKGWQRVVEPHVVSVV